MANSSLSSNVSGMAAQLTFTSGPADANTPLTWMTSASTFLPNAASRRDEHARLGGRNQRSIAKDRNHQRLRAIT